MLKPLKLPMKRCCPLNARSELAKFNPLPRGGAGGAGGLGFSGLASGLASGFESGLGSLSGSVGSPAGIFGSKKPGGFGRLDTSSMLRAACPASFNPGLRPTRGSVDGTVACVAGRSCATTPAPTIRRTAPTHPNAAATAFISRAPSTSSAFHACGRSPYADRRRRPTRTHKSRIPARRRRWNTAPSPLSVRPRDA